MIEMDTGLESESSMLLMLSPNSSGMGHSENVNNSFYRSRSLTNESITIYRNRNYGDRTLASLANLRSEDQLCDVVLVAGAAPEECVEADLTQMNSSELTNNELNAHRVLLAACCPYFRAMFVGDMSESRQQRVYIQGVHPTALSLLIDYIYSAQVHITEENVQLLLPASSLLQLNEIRQACCEFLNSRLHPSNCLGIRAFADLHDCDQLLRSADNFTEQHFGELVQCEEFLTLNVDKLSKLISSDRLTTAGEEKVFEAVISWIRYDPSRRQDDLPHLMEYVRLPLLSQDYLVEKVDSEPLIRESPICKDFLIEALKYHLMKTDRKAVFQSPRVRPRQPLGLPKLLMVIGGQAPKAIRNVDIYDVQTEQWSCVCELPQRRCRCGVALIAGGVYAVGGFNGSLRIRTVDVLDPLRNSWSSAASMEARRSTLGVTVLESRVVAVGGFDGSTGLASCEAFDPRTAQWHTIASMTTKRSSVGVGVLKGNLYAIGGYDGQSRQCLSTVERYESRMDKWISTNDMTTRRSGAGVTVIDDNLYTIGGHDGPMVKKSAEVYDCEMDEWTLIADMALCRRNAGVVSVHEHLYAVGGDDGSANLASVEMYNPKHDSWSTLSSSMHIGRSYAGVIMLSKSGN